MATIGQQLVLVPTRLELQLGAERLIELCQRHQLLAVECGLGLVQSAVRTTRLLETLRPAQVWLLGIAGAYGDQLPPGEAYEFARVTCDGIGLGTGAEHQSIHQVGWDQFLETPSPQQIQLHTNSSNLELLSVAAASANQEQAAHRQRAYPAAAAEEMECYAVALACVSGNVPMRVIRGISNQAGDRDHGRWQSGPAMQSAVALLEQLLDRSEIKP